MNTKPTLIHVIAWTTLTSGIINLLWGFAASGTALVSIIGILCVPFAFFPTILGVFELIYAAKLFSNQPQDLKPSTNIAVFEIACVLLGNVFSMAVGILSLVFYNDTIVKQYFAGIDGTLTPAPVTPSMPASLPQPNPSDPSQDKPAPVILEPVSPLKKDTPIEEPPAKPKRTPRKVAKK